MREISQLMKTYLSKKNRQGEALVTPEGKNAKKGKEQSTEEYLEAKEEIRNGLDMRMLQT